MTYAHHPLPLRNDVLDWAMAIAAEEIPFTREREAFSRTPHSRRPDTVAAEAVRRLCRLNSPDAVTRMAGLYPDAIRRAQREEPRRFERVVQAVVRRLDRQFPLIERPSMSAPLSEKS